MCTLHKLGIHQIHQCHQCHDMTSVAWVGTGIAIYEYSLLSQIKYYYLWLITGMPSHQSSPSSPTYRCRLESFRRDTSRRRYCHCWRRLGSTALRQRITGPYPICQLSRRSLKDSCWHACVLICSSRPTSVNISLRTGRDTRRKQRCWRSSMECTLRPMTSR